MHSHRVAKLQKNTYSPKKVRNFYYLCSDISLFCRITFKKMKAMWMMIFLLLPLLGIAYIAWHVWCLLPCAWWWRVLAIALLAGSFLTMMFGMRGLYDRMPLSIGTALYEIGTSSIFIMMYLVMLFLLLDIGRLCHLIPRTLLYNN